MLHIWTNLFVISSWKNPTVFKRERNEKKEEEVSSVNAMAHVKLSIVQLRYTPTRLICLVL